MINRITEIMGNVYYVGEAEKANKGAPVSTAFKKYETGRIEKVQRVSKLNALDKQEQEIERNAQVHTEIVKDEKGTSSVILMANRYTYREINLNGESQKPEIQYTNPVKIKAAYFNNDL